MQVSNDIQWKQWCSRTERLRESIDQKSFQRTGHFVPHAPLPVEGFAVSKQRSLARARGADLNATGRSTYTSDFPRKEANPNMRAVGESSRPVARSRAAAAGAPAAVFRARRCIVTNWVKNKKRRSPERATQWGSIVFYRFFQLNLSPLVVAFICVSVCI
jgi:hypothetical protein